MGNELSKAINSAKPLPTCIHGKPLMDHGGEHLEPPCGCKATKPTMDAYATAIILIRDFELAISRLDAAYARNPNRIKTVAKNYEAARAKLFKALTGTIPTTEQNKAMNY